MSDRIDEAGLRWPSLPSASPSSGGGLGAILKGGLGAAAPWASAIGSGIDIVGKIASLFAPNTDKTTATKLQQNIEKTATSIEQMVKSGQMDVDAGIAALQALQRQATTMGGTQENANGGATANLTVTQVLANLTNERNARNSNPLNGGALNGDASSQKARVGTAVRNYFTGAGNSGIEGSPLEALTKPVQSPTDRLPATGDALKQFAPNIAIPDLGKRAPVVRY